MERYKCQAHCARDILTLLFPIIIIIIGCLNVHRSFMNGTKKENENKQRRFWFCSVRSCRAMNGTSRPERGLECHHAAHHPP